MVDFETVSSRVAELNKQARQKRESQTSPLHAENQKLRDALMWIVENSPGGKEGSFPVRAHDVARQALGLPDEGPEE
jgi:hypothetical protein